MQACLALADPAVSQTTPECEKEAVTVRPVTDVAEYDIVGLLRADAFYEVLFRL